MFPSTVFSPKGFCDIKVYNQASDLVRIVRSIEIIINTVVTARGLPAPIAVDIATAEKQIVAPTVAP